MPHKFSITTKTGDEGLTSLYSGERVYKNSERPTVYGEVDMLEAMLGLARAHAQNEDTRRTLAILQKTLFTINAELATSKEKLGRLKARIDEAAVARIDAMREELEDRVAQPTDFIISGDCVASAHIDLAKTQARRCERLIVGLFRDGVIDNRFIIVWMNRLSDFLYLLARSEGPNPTLVKSVPD